MLKHLLSIAILAPLVIQTVCAQTSAHQIVSVRIDPIVVLAASGDPQHLIANGERRSMSDQSTWYNLTTNVSDIAISAALDRAMPAGTHLRLAASTTLGLSTGEVEISGPLAVDLVSAIGRGLENGQRLAYRVEFDPELESVPVQERVVSLSLYDPATGQHSVAEQTLVFGLESIGSE